MPDWMLPPSFVALRAEFRPVFTRPSFDSFRVIVCGWVHAIGRHCVSDAIRAASAVATKHYCAYYRFLSHGRWSLDDLGLHVLGLVISAFGLEQVELVLDDTLTRRSGKKVALAGMHRDPLLRQGRRAFFSYGHVFVVLAVHVSVPALGPTGWALPFMFRLFEGPHSGGKANAPSDRRRSLSRRRKGAQARRRLRMTDRKVVRGQVTPCELRRDTGPLPEALRPTKLQLAAEMIIHVARRFPELRFRVVADNLYAGRAVLHEVHGAVGNVNFIVRGRPDAALYELPPERLPGRKGRPRVKGDRLPSPEQWAKAHPRAFRTVQVDIYGEQVTLRGATFDGMAYRSLPGRLCRYVIVKDPRGVYRTDYLLTTDMGLSAAEVVESYSRRWPLERTFQDAKQKLGIEDPQTQLPGSVRRSAPLGLLVYSLVVFWFLTDGHREARRLRRRPDPWAAPQRRPSFANMLAALRRLGWARTFADLPRQLAARSKNLVEFIQTVVAAA